MNLNKNSELSFHAGWSGVIAGYHDEHIAKHLLAIGLTPGTRVAILGRSPFGQTYRVHAKDRSVALRVLELEAIQFQTD